MCIHFTSNPTSSWVGGFWGNGHLGPAAHEQQPVEVWPHQLASIVLESSVGPVCHEAVFGLVPHWTRERVKGSTMNARSETVAKLPSFNTAWRKNQRCLIPMTRFFEPYYPPESKRSIETAIGRVDGEPFTAAGIYDMWTDRVTGDNLISFAMLTINADGHPLMGRMHKPKEEKRSLVVIEPIDREYWLKSNQPNAMMNLLTPLNPDEYGVIAP